MNKEKIKKIMERTCYKSIAYCCGLEKHCDVRDGVLAELGLTKKRFVELKKVFDNLIHDVLKEKNEN